MSEIRRALEIVHEEGVLTLCRKATTHILHQQQRRFAERNPSQHTRYKKAKNRYLRGFKAVPEPYALIRVDPEEIRHYTKREMYYWHHELAGEVVEGDWDTEIAPISHHWKYIDMVSRLKYGIEWEHTHHYQRLAAAGQLRDIESDLTAYDRLYEKIKAEGFKSSREMEGDTNKNEDVCVAVGRSGEILFTGSGWHRLSIAKLLDLKEIPVRVLIRHRDWQLLRERVYASNNLSTSLSDAGVESAHPDLQDVIEGQK